VRRILLVALLAACAPSSPPSPPLVPLRLDAIAADGLVVDGAIDHGWSRAAETTVPLGPAGEVKLKAAHDGKRLYLLAIWSDPSASMSRFWKYQGDLKWTKSGTEDGFAVMWCPKELEAGFRGEGCAVACHDRHVFEGTGNGHADFWYWGAQQCALFPQARDMWLRQGAEQRLRGDSQPEDSDNAPNLSDKYEGPKGFPGFRRDGDDRILPFGKNLREVTPEWIKEHWKEPTWIGHEVPLDLLRERKGSRGDVAAAGRHLGKAWVLEMARDFRTGNRDDLVLGDGPVLFAIAVWGDAAGAAHAVSGPIELRFLTAP
jgi:hypothetical protein